METSQPSRTAPAVSVVIPCLNAARTLREQLAALSTQDFQGVFEIVFVDNGSTDESVDIAREYADRPGGLRVIDGSARKGAGAARNRGVEAARSEKILFCDADDVVTEVWVRLMAGALDDHPMVAGGRDFHRLTPDWHPVMHSREKGTDENTICDVHFIGRPNIPTVGAGNFGIRRSLFLQIEGYDLDLPIHEDDDLCIRAYRAGATLHLCPEALVLIRVRSDLGSAFKQGSSWGYWAVGLWKKHRSVLGRPPVMRPLVGWPMLVIRLLKVRNHGDWVAWLYRLGWKSGSLWGSVRMGFPAP